MNSKCLIFIDTLEIGGTEKSIYEITSRFKSVRPIIVHLFKGDALKAKFEARGIEVISLNLKSPFSVIENFRAVRLLYARHKPDAVMAHLFFAEFYCRLAALGTNIKLIGSFVNDSYGEERYKKSPFLTRMKLHIYQWLDAITAVRCNAFLANSKTIALSNARALGISAAKISVIYRGRNTDQFHKPYVSSMEQLRFVNVGRLIERKGQADLITAFKKIVDRYPKARLSIAGDGYQRNVLKKLVNDLDLQLHVQLLGQVNDVVSLLYASEFFVFTSHFEGFSGALVEAMMVGMPIIASDIEMTKEAIRHKQEGYLYKSASEIDIVNAMEYMINNRNYAIQMGVQARLKAFELYNIDEIARQTEEFLVSCIKV